MHESYQRLDSVHYLYLADENMQNDIIESNARRFDTVQELIFFKPVATAKY